VVALVRFPHQVVLVGPVVVALDQTQITMQLLVLLIPEVEEVALETVVMFQMSCQAQAAPVLFFSNTQSLFLQ
jgi:hypothetical protein